MKYDKMLKKAEELYNYLKNKHLGIENGIKKKELSIVVGIDERELRRLTAYINKSNKFEKLISTRGYCYMCRNAEECLSSIINTYKVAVSQFKKAKSMEKKLGLNGQYKIRLGEDYKEFVETFTE